MVINEIFQEKNIGGYIINPNPLAIICKKCSTRYGENGAYSSGIIFAFFNRNEHGKAIVEALRLAKQKGFKVQES
jgi:hypothetical protein